MVPGGKYIRNQADAISAPLDNFLGGKCKMAEHKFTKFNKIMATSAYIALVMEIS